MSSIVEEYKVIKTKEDIASGMNAQLPSLEDDGFVRRQGPVGGEFKPRNSVINKLEVSSEDKAWNELVTSLGQRVKDHNKDAHEITVYTGGASAIKIQVVGYADSEAVNAARAQEDAVHEDLPPVETPRTTRPDEATDQVAAVRAYNTNQYMKHSTLNPKKFG